MGVGPLEFQLSSESEEESEEEMKKEGLHMLWRHEWLDIWMNTIPNLVNPRQMRWSGFF